VSQRTIRLFGFEEGLAEMIIEKFRFSITGFDDLVLVGGRHVFVQMMRTAEEIAVSVAAEVGAKPYDPQREPTIGIGVNTGPGVPPTSSSSSKQEWNIQIVLRQVGVPELAKALLEDLGDFLLLKRGRLSTGFQIKGTEMLSRPTILDVLKDNSVLASTVIKFRAVPLPR